MQVSRQNKREKNKLQATLEVWNCPHWLTDLLTGVKCRATSVAKKKKYQRKRRLFLKNCFPFFFWIFVLISYVGAAEMFKHKSRKRNQKKTIRNFLTRGNIKWEPNMTMPTISSSLWMSPCRKYCFVSSEADGLPWADAGKLVFLHQLISAELDQVSSIQLWAPSCWWKPPLFCWVFHSTAFVRGVQSHSFRDHLEVVFLTIFIIAIIAITILINIFKATYF